MSQKKKKKQPKLNGFAQTTWTDLAVLFYWNEEKKKN